MTDPTIHAAAAPNYLACGNLRLRPTDRDEVSVDPARAGWRYLSFATSRLSGDEPLELEAGSEHAIVVIAGSDVRVAVEGGHDLVVSGRDSPFAALPAACYVPAGCAASLDGAGALVAVASAPPSGRSGVSTSPALVSRADVRVEIRGAGNATRQINHIITPDFPADRLEVVEVLTPSGNWSSWPPHKHDVDDWPTEAVLEEVYCYQFRRDEAWGMQRLYRPDRSRDCAWEVRSGDVVLVTDGYHPFVAAHGDDAYYLNALAGDRRTMACSFDPTHSAVRDQWPEMAPDPRVPLVSLEGSAVER